MGGLQSVNTKYFGIAFPVAALNLLEDSVGLCIDFFNVALPHLVVIQELGELLVMIFKFTWTFEKMEL